MAMQSHDSFDEMAAGTGELNAGGAVRVFDVNDLGQFERRSLDWLKSNFFSCEHYGQLTELVYRHTPTGTLFVLDQFVNSEQEALAFHKQLQAEMREADTDTWVPAERQPKER